MRCVFVVVQTVRYQVTQEITDFRGTVTGESPITDKTDTIQDINALFLWNDSTRWINFVSDNSIALNTILLSSK